MQYSTYRTSQAGGGALQGLEWVPQSIEAMMGLIGGRPTNGAWAPNVWQNYNIGQTTVYLISPAGQSEQVWQGGGNSIPAIEAAAVEAFRRTVQGGWEGADPDVIAAVVNSTATTYQEMLAVIEQAQSASASSEEASALMYALAGGDTGATGAAGPTGAAGETASNGASIETGATGTGSTGTQGATGSTAATESAGNSGATGTIGATGASGVAGATGAVGATGSTSTDGNTRAAEQTDPPQSTPTDRQADPLDEESSAGEIPTDWPAIEITPETLSSGMPQTKMAFLGDARPSEFLQNLENQAPIPLHTMSMPDDSATIGSLAAGVQLDLAKEILHGISDGTTQYGIGSPGVQPHDAAPAGSLPSFAHEDGGRGPNGMIKPNGS